MQYIAAIAAFAGVVAAQASTASPTASPTSVISAPGGIATGCNADYPSLFQIQVVQPASTKRSVERRQMNTPNGMAVVAQIKGGIMASTNQAVAYVAGGNHQFQFTTPQQMGQPQPGFIYDAGFSVCGNGSIAHGDSTVFYECTGGDRNILADINIYGSPQCFPVNLQAINYSGGSVSVAPTSSAPATTAPVSTPSATTVTPIVTSPDGQPAQSTTSVVVLTSDNQPAAPTPVAPQSTPAQFTGAAQPLKAGSFAAAAAGVFAVAML